MTERIPLAKPELTKADRSAVMQVLQTTHLSMGPKLAEFERAICEYTGAKHAVAVNSGTSGLQLAIDALGIEAETEVILPSFTFSALLNVILHAELRPKFVDIEATGYNCSAEQVLAAVTQKTKLILAVHTFGIPSDVAGILRGLEVRGLRRPGQMVSVIEDACEALGADVGGYKAGSLGDVGLFAFYPNKQVTTGEGGMLVTSDERVARKSAQLRNQGRDPTLGWNSHVEVGFSYRISDLNCTLGISQLARIEDTIARRQQLAESYDRALTPIKEILRPRLTSTVGRISWFVYTVRLADSFTAADRDAICRSMLQKGVETGRYFAPLHKQPVLTKAEARKLLTESTEERRRVDLASSLGNTEHAADRVIALPFFNELTDAQIQQVCSALSQSIHELRRKT